MKLNINFRKFSEKILFAVCLASISLFTQAGEIPKSEEPALITSLGQAPDGFAVSVVAKRAKLGIDYNTLISPEDIKKYKTVILAFGVSLKGFGAAGVNLDTEIARGAELIKIARENNIKLIGLHSGGEGRRDIMSNKLLDLYANKMDAFIVYKDGNKDGYFTKMEETSQVPVIVLNKMNEVQTVLTTMFSK